MSALAPARPRSEADDLTLAPWLKRRTAAREDRKRYESQWQINQFFAAGIQWLARDERTGRVLEDPKARDRNGRPLDVVDVLSQYNGTVLGKLAQGDLRPELLAQYKNDEQADLYAEQLNDAVEFAWEEECKLDRHFLSILRGIIELGTMGTRTRYDRAGGKLLANEVPHQNGKPLLDPAEAQAYVQQQFVQGAPADLRPLREGKIVCEKLSAWNILPPPGIDNPQDFPWELIVRPVHLSELKMVYGPKAVGVTADKVEDLGMLAFTAGRSQNGSGGSPAVASQLTEHALVYTGYLKPNDEYSNGQTVVFTNDGHLLDEAKGLPLQMEPWGPRSGITYYRWQILEGRFWGRAFMEPGIGPQKIRNKRSSQIDLTIDAGQPKVFVEEGSIDTSKIKGTPLEIIKIKPGATLPRPDGGIAPGQWMQADIELQDTNIQKALGLYGAGVGDSPSNVTTYGQLALLTENEVVKFGPIGTEFALGRCDVVRDVIETMNNWPSDKQLLLAGEGNRLRSVAFEAKKAIPAAYLVRPPAGGSLPRSQGAELQKVTDIWTAALAAGVVVANPQEWMEWYTESLNAGQAQDIPTLGMGIEQRHKAALENAVMVHTGQVVPVAPFDDHQIHVEEHDEEQIRLSQALAMGDQSVQTALAALEQHKQLHLQQAALSAQQNQQAGLTQPQQPAPGR
jgi:hypothetical protein